MKERELRKMTSWILFEDCTEEDQRSVEEFVNYVRGACGGVGSWEKEKGQ